jgi:hypothetical protein
MKHMHIDAHQRALPLSFFVALEAYTTGDAQGSPTIASGDWKISKDGAAFANLATLPDAEPDSTNQLRIQLSESELDADWVTIMGVDQTTDKEWEDFCITIRLKGATVKVATDAGNSATAFKITTFGLGTEANDHLLRTWLKARTGALKGQVAKVTDYVAATDIVTVDVGYTGTPADGVYFEVVNG